MASAVKLREFNEQGDNWIKVVHSHMQEARGANKNVLPSDSIEVASIGAGLEVSSLEHFTFIKRKKFFSQFPSYKRNILLQEDVDSWGKCIYLILIQSSQSSAMPSYIVLILHYSSQDCIAQLLR